MYICIYIYVHMYMYVWWPPSRGPIFDISMRPNKKLIGYHGRYPGGFSSKPRVISSSDVTGMMLRRGIISGISQFNKYISAILRLVIIIQPDIHIYDYIWLWYIHHTSTHKCVISVFQVRSIDLGAGQIGAVAMVKWGFRKIEWATGLPLRYGHVRWNGIKTRNWTLRITLWWTFT